MLKFKHLGVFVKKITFVLLLVMGSVANASRREGLNQLLCEAVRKGDVAKAQGLLGQGGANVNCNCTENNITPILFASANGDKRMFDMLMDKGANAHVADKNGFTTYHIVALGSWADTTVDTACDRIDILATLAGKKVEVNRITKQGHNTPLHLAMFDCRMYIVQALLQAGASCEKVNDAGKNALNIAHDNCNEEFLKKLQDFIAASAKK